MTERWNPFDRTKRDGVEVKANQRCAVCNEVIRRSTYAYAMKPVEKVDEQGRQVNLYPRFDGSMSLHFTFRHLDCPPERT